MIVKTLIALVAALVLSVPAQAQSGLMPQNSFWAGPTAGGQGFGGPRSIVAADLPSTSVQSIVNDTNIQGAIANQILTFSWAGTLAAGRLNANVVQGITNDTNVTGSIAAQNLTLGWAGTLAVGRGGTGLASGTSGGLLCYTASGTLASSASLGLNNVVVGGGVGACPKDGGPVRTKLAAPTTYYVTAAGVDSDNCTIGAPCLTPQRASDNLQKLIDTGGQPVTISITNPSPAPFTVSAPYFGDKCAVTFVGSPSITITNATNATPVVITASGHAYTNGMHVVISGVGGNTAANGAFIVAAANIGAGTFALTKEVDATNVAGNGAYTSGGTVAAPRNNVIAASGAGQSAILATNSACFSVQGFSLSSTQAQPLASFYTSQIYLSGKMDFGASAAAAAQVYATRSGFIEFDDAFSISGATYEFQQASHGGQIRHQNFNGYLTANLTYNNPVDPNTAFSLAQGEGQIIETGATGYTLQGFTVTAQAQYRIFENGNIETAGLSPPASTYFPGTATGNQIKLGNGTLGPNWWLDVGNNDGYAVIGTGTHGWCLQKNDNSVNYLCFNNGGLGTGPDGSTWGTTGLVFAKQITSTFGTPAIASGACGAGTNGTISGTNQSGIVTIGAAATTTCTISFSTTITAPSACVIFPGNATAAAQGTTVARVGTPSTTAWVITGSALASSVYSYLCL